MVVSRTSISFSLVSFHVCVCARIILVLLLWLYGNSLGWVFCYFQHLSLPKTGQTIQEPQLLKLFELFVGDFDDHWIDFVEGNFYVAIFTGLLLPIVVWYFDCVLIKEACLESEGRSSHRLTIDVWITVERGTGSGKAGWDRIFALLDGGTRKVWSHWWQLPVLWSFRFFTPISDS